MSVLGNPLFPGGAVAGGALALLARTASGSVTVGGVTQLGANALYGYPLPLDLCLPDLLSAADYAFSSCTGLTAIRLPNAAAVGVNAFIRCFSLASADIPNVETLGTNAFNNCTALSTVCAPALRTVGVQAFQSCGALQEVRFPNLRTLGSGAFANCGALQEVSLPEVRTLWYSAFQSCYALAAAVFPEAETMYYGAFSGCSALSLVYMPRAKIGSGYPTSFFNGCASLQSVTLGWLSLSGYRISAIFPQAYSKLEHLALPQLASVDVASAFSGCSALRELYLPEAVTLASSAIYDLRSLRALDLGYFSASFLPGHVSLNCAATLEELRMGRIMRLSNSAFYNWAALRSVRFDSLAEIGAGAFMNCAALAALYLPSAAVCALAHSNALANTLIARGSGSVYVPASLVSLYRDATNWTYFSDRIFAMEE